MEAWLSFLPFGILLLPLKSLQISNNNFESFLQEIFSKDSLQTNSKPKQKQNFGSIQISKNKMPQEKFSIQIPNLKTVFFNFDGVSE